MPEIGDELAAGRAMNDLAGQLLKTADRASEGMGTPTPHGRKVAGGPT